MQRFVHLSCLIVLCLSRNLFSVNQAVQNGVISIFDLDSARLEVNNFTLPLGELAIDLSLPLFVKPHQQKRRARPGKTRLQLTPPSVVDGYDTSTVKP